MSRGPFDALIVGAGPAGASAATLLARAGWSVAIVEKHAFPRRKVCGECVAASNLPLLEALGVLPSTLDAIASPALHHVALMRRNRCVTAPLPAAANLQHTWARAIGRETLDTLLLDQARRAGAVVLQPWSVQSIGGTAGRFRVDAVDLAAAEKIELHARVVILANGSWEPLQADRQIRRRARRASDLLAFKANFLGADLEPGLLPVLAFEGGYGGMVVADGGITTIACCIRSDRLAVLRATAPGQSAGDVVEALLRRECEGVDTALRHAERIGSWLGSGPIDPGIRLRDDDAVFRIGNAAGEAHPIIGEGMSMAMQSAWLLCDHLLQASPAGSADASTRWHADVARRYAREWRRHFALRLRIAAALAHVAMRPWLSSIGVAAAQRLPGAITLGARWCAKVRCAIDPRTVAHLSAPAPYGPAGPPTPAPARERAIAYQSTP